MLEMQTRVRQKEAKRKEMEAESMARKKRCDREERIAKVQIDAYWDLYPLPLSIEEAKSTAAPDSEDDELIEDQNHETKADLGTEKLNESEQELVDDDNLGNRCGNKAPCMRSSIRHERCTRMAASNARRALLETFAV